MPDDGLPPGTTQKQIDDLCDGEREERIRDRISPDEIMAEFALYPANEAVELIDPGFVEQIVENLVAARLEALSAHNSKGRGI